MPSPPASLEAQAAALSEAALGEATPGEATPGSIPATPALEAAEDVADFLQILGPLREALGDLRGKIRVEAVRRLLGLERSSYHRSRLIARAMRHLGWKRRRFRIAGSLVYAYAKGTSLQREVLLEVEEEASRMVVCAKARERTA